MHFNLYLCSAISSPHSNHHNWRTLLSVSSTLSQNIETSSTTSHVPRGPHPPPVTRQASTPPAQRRELSESPRRPHHPDTRPKTMFIAAPGDHQNMDAHSHTSQQQKHQLQQPMDVTAGTGKKKRRAPAPPGPSAPAKEHRAQTHNGGHLTTEPLHERVEGEARQQQQQPLSRADVLSRLHSRNSSDSSGYHELPLSGAESPEAPGFYDHQTQHQDEAADKLKSSTASISSGHDSSGANGDSGVHDLSPMRVSPIREVSEKSDVPSVSASAPAAGGGKKKRKAPAPPAPPSSSQPSRPLESLATTTTTITTTADVPPLNVRAVEPELQAKLERPVETESSQSSGKNKDKLCIASGQVRLEENCLVPFFSQSSSKNGTGRKLAKSTFISALS